MKNYVVEILASDAALGEAKLDRQFRKPVVVLFPAEALFFRGSDQVAVANQGCGAC